MDMEVIEVFENTGDLCIVLKRVGSTVLILRLNNHYAYVVPMVYVKGSSDWQQGRYFTDIEPALEYFKEEVGKEGGHNRSKSRKARGA